MWTHFNFKSGSNPYIAMTSKEKQRIINKYKGKTKQVGEDMYEINDISRDMTNWICDQVYSLIK